MKVMLGMPGSGGNARGYLCEKYYPGSVIVKEVEGWQVVASLFTTLARLMKHMR